jgi:hypothetical protein
MLVQIKETEYESDGEDGGVCTSEEGGRGVGGWGGGNDENRF